MSVKTVVYTAIFGGKDKPWRVKRFKDVEFVLFTDEPGLNAPGWKVEVCDSSFADARKSSRILKILPHRYFASHRYSIWVDGTRVPRGDPQRLIRRFLTSGVAAFRHPDHDCIYKEAERCVRLGFDRGTIEAQMERYRRAGYPEQNGLAECAVLVREHNRPEVMAAMEAWWSEIEQGSIRDQLSFDFVMWKHGLQCDLIPGHVIWNDLFYCTPHGTNPNRIRSFIESKRNHQNPLCRALPEVKDWVGRVRDRFGFL